MVSLLKKYLFYLVRWQLSTPILAVCVISFATLGATWSTVIANLIGGVIFFWIDRWIFRNTSLLGEIWEVRSNEQCHDCGKQTDRAYRLAKFGKYDRMNDKSPQFRCHDCSRAKYGRMFRDRDAAKGGEFGAAVRN